MANTTSYPKTEWYTLHRNGPHKLKLLQITRLEGQATMPSAVDCYNDAAFEMQRLIKEALDNNHGFRAYGSRWSMSSVAHNKDRMHYNAYMNLSFPILPQDMHSNANYDSTNLYFFQCGNTVKEISQVFEKNGKSLKVSGASNGQTIAGCISTGVHGSALNEGSVQDHVVGINLIIGPNPEDIVYLERHTKPALNDAFAQKFNARVIRNDGLFNAALVSLGSFGFIHGVVVEGEDLYLLKRYVRKIDKKVALKLSETMDFKNTDFKIDGETDANGKGKTPYHYKVFINPYIDDGKYVVELMYKKPHRSSYPDPFTTIDKSLYRDVIHLLIQISRKFPKSIPWFIKKLQKQILPDVNEESLGTLYETFWDAPYKGPAFACSFGVDVKDCAKALKVLVDLTKKEGPIPGIYAMRFIKKSDATLSFAQFPTTCMIEIDGVLWKESKKLISLERFSKRMIEVLQQNNIPFTIQWGKNSSWNFPGLVDYMYGDKAKTWKSYRSALLSKDMQKLFSNDFLEQTGLSESESDDIHIPEDLIVSL